MNLNSHHLTFHLSLYMHTHTHTHTQRASLADEEWSGVWSAEDIKWSVFVCMCVTVIVGLCACVFIESEVDQGQ